jgi:hypothetical protein
LACYAQLSGAIEVTAVVTAPPAAPWAPPHLRLDTDANIDRAVRVIFSTYRGDSIINRLDRAELTVDQCPAEVAEVLELGREAEQASEGAFSIMLPLLTDVAGLIRAEW